MKNQYIQSPIKHLKSLNPAAQAFYQREIGKSGDFKPVSLLSVLVRNVLCPTFRQLWHELLAFDPMYPERERQLLRGLHGFQDQPYPAAAAAASSCCGSFRQPMPSAIPPFAAAIVDIIIAVVVVALVIANYILPFDSILAQLLRNGAFL